MKRITSLLLALLLACGTFCAAASGLEEGQTLKRGDDSDLVLAAEERLGELGYLQEAPDRHFGHGTRDAVRAFQKDMGLEETGTVGIDTWEALFGGGETVELTAGEIVAFGVYEQDGDPSNGPEPIEWIVLEAEGGTALLVSRFALEKMPFHTSKGYYPWAESSLRAWMNGDLLQTAFTAAERRAILKTRLDNSGAQGVPGFEKKSEGETEDFVFALSYAEVLRYFGSEYAARCMGTPRVRALGGDHVERDGGYVPYWLRSFGKNVTEAALISSLGKAFNRELTNGYSYVRPAARVALDRGAPFPVVGAFAAEPEPTPQPLTAPEGLPGTWRGTADNVLGGEKMDLVVGIGSDGTGIMSFSRDPQTIGFACLFLPGGMMAIAVPEGSTGLDAITGTWKVEDGVMRIDMRLEYTGGSSRSYRARCTKE